MIVSKHTGYDTLRLIHGKGRQFAHARNILCHIVQSEFPHLTDTLAEMTGATKFDIIKADANISAQSSRNPRLLAIISDIREDLSLPRLDIVEKKEIPASVQLFGFRWTEHDMMCMRKAMDDSVKYMQKLCKIGRQPIKEGMVFAPMQREKKPKRSWYNEQDNRVYTQTQ